MKATDQELLSQWLDDELEPAAAEAFAARVESEPELSQAADLLREVRAELGDVASAPAVEPPSPEFFNRHLLRQIEDEMAPAPAEVRAPEPARAAGPGLFGRLLPWSVASVATACAVFFALRAPSAAVAADHSTVSSVYSPVDGVEAETYYAADAGMTVIVVEGLEEIPADTKLIDDA